MTMPAIPPQASPPQQQGFVTMPGGYPPAQGGQAPAPMPQAMQQFAANPGPAGAPLEGNSIPMPQLPAPAAPAPQAPQAPAPQGVDPNARLSGPNVPAELQGRTMAEVMQTYNGMKQVVMQMVPGPTAPPLPGLARPVPMPQPVAQNVQQPVGPAAGPVPQWDWRNPEQSIGNVIARELDTRLAPLLQREQQNGVNSARAEMVREFGPVWSQLEPLVAQRLAGADAEAMQNPQVWRVATEAVVGQLAMQAAARGVVPQAQGAPGTAAPQMQVPGQQPMPNLNGFFTEAPRAGAPVAGVAQLTPQQEWVRTQMGMSVDDYFAWSGGARR